MCYETCGIIYTHIHSTQKEHEHALFLPRKQAGRQAWACTCYVQTYLWYTYIYTHYILTRMYVFLHGRRHGLVYIPYIHVYVI
jgi:hypothetical protein